MIEVSSCKAKGITEIHKWKEVTTVLCTVTALRIYGILLPFISLQIPVFTEAQFFFYIIIYLQSIFNLLPIFQFLFLNFHFYLIRLADR